MINSYIIIISCVPVLLSLYICVCVCVCACVFNYFNIPSEYLMDRATPVLETITQLKNKVESYAQDPQGECLMLHRIIHFINFEMFKFSTAGLDLSSSCFLKLRKSA